MSTRLLGLMLSRSNVNQGWGFGVGINPPDTSFRIIWIDDKAPVCDHLSPGDKVLEVEGIDTALLSQAEVDGIIDSPGRHLELLVVKKSPVRRSLPRDSAEFPSKQDDFWVAPKCAPRAARSLETLSQKLSNEDLRSQDRTGRVLFDKNLSDQVTKSRNDFQKVQRFEPAKTTQKNDFQKIQKFEPAKTPQKNEDVTQSSILQLLNNRENAKKGMDPREQKRRFWDDCRRSESVRRFKWGDSVSPVRRLGDSKFTASLENLTTIGKYDTKNSRTSNRMKRESFIVKGTERARSCEPEEGTSSTNPFILKEFPVGTPAEELSQKRISTNPFLNETYEERVFGQTRSHSDGELFTDKNVIEMDPLERKVAPRMKDSMYKNEAHKKQFAKHYSIFEKAHCGSNIEISERADEILSKHFRDNRFYGSNEDYSVNDFTKGRGTQSEPTSTVSSPRVQRKAENHSESIGRETPSGFYDNFDDLYSVVNEQSEPFDAVREKLGRLLGGTPLNIKSPRESTDSLKLQTNFYDCLYVSTSAPQPSPSFRKHSIFYYEQFSQIVFCLIIWFLYY